MLMNVFEYNICPLSSQGTVASTDDLDLAKEIALMLATEKHTDVNIINAFTGEVHYSLETVVHISYNSKMKEIERTYEVKEVEW